MIKQSGNITLAILLALSIASCSSGSGNGSSSQSGQLTSSLSLSAFGITQGGTKTVSMTISNSGTQTLSSLSFTSLGTGLSVSTSNCTGTLAAGASCTATLAYSRSSGGSSSGTTYTATAIYGDGANVSTSQTITAKVFSGSYALPTGVSVNSLHNNQNNFHTIPGELTLATYKDGLNLYVATTDTTDYKIYKSTDAGNTFGAAVGLGSGGAITSIPMILHNAIYATGDDVYIGTSLGLYISTDGGQTFTQQGPTDPVYAIFTASNGTIYVGTSNGLYSGTNTTFATHVLATKSVEGVGETSNGIIYAVIDNGGAGGTDSLLYSSADNFTTEVADINAQLGVAFSASQLHVDASNNIFVTNNAAYVAKCTNSGVSWACTNVAPSGAASYTHGLTGNATYTFLGADEGLYAYSGGAFPLASTVTGLTNIMTGLPGTIGDEPGYNQSLAAYGSSLFIAVNTYSGTAYTGLYEFDMSSA